MAQGTVSISLSELKVGVTCSHPIVDDDGVLLLGANNRITSQLISGLRDRGIESIDVDPRDLAALRGGAAKKKTVTRRERASDAQWPKAKPVKDLLVDRHEEDLSEERTKKLTEDMEKAKDQFVELRNSLAEHHVESVESLTQISDCYARSIVDDHDQTVGITQALGGIDDPDQRSVRMSTLGMAVAVELGLDAHQTLEVGMTGLLHDIGLNAMDPKFRRPIEAMSEAEQWEYRKHPLVSVLCIADVMDVSAPVQLAMQQVHEQFDGSGYPRGVKGQRIHMYARILNVVDAYLQLTSPTPSRPAVVPHDALGLMLHQAGRGYFDPQVIRAFLNVESLFPLGSMVELDSGKAARVIRRPVNGFAAPVLIDEDGKRVELEDASVQIIRPVCDPEIDQIRILPDQMPTSNWHPGSHTSLT